MFAHLRLQLIELVPAVDEKPNEIRKSEKGFVAARFCLFDNLLRQNGILGLTPPNHISGVGTQEASLIMQTPSEEMVEG